MFNVEILGFFFLFCFGLLHFKYSDLVLHLLVWQNSHCSLVCHQTLFSSTQAAQFCACREGKKDIIHTAVMTLWHAVKCGQHSDDDSQAAKEFPHLLLFTDIKPEY